MARIWGSAWNPRNRDVEKYTWICEECNTEYLSRDRASMCNHTKKYQEVNTGYYQFAPLDEEEEGR